MSRPQFTLRTMFIAVGLLALSFGCFRAAFLVHRSAGIGLCYFGLVAIGTGIGAVCNRPREWTAAMAIIGIGLFLVLALVLEAIH